MAILPSSLLHPPKPHLPSSLTAFASSPLLYRPKSLPPINISLSSSFLHSLPSLPNHYFSLPSRLYSFNPLSPITVFPSSFKQAIPHAPSSSPSSLHFSCPLLTNVSFLTSRLPYHSLPLSGYPSLSIPLLIPNIPSLHPAFHLHLLPHHSSHPHTLFPPLTFTPSTPHSQNASPALPPSLPPAPHLIPSLSSPLIPSASPSR